MAKIFGGKVTLWRAITASVGETTFLQIPQVTDLATSGGESNMITTTNRDDLIVALAEVQQPALISPASVDFTVQFDMDLTIFTGAGGLISDAENQVERNYQIRATGLTNKAKFRGFQKALPQSFDMAQIVLARTGIACSSRITYSP